MPVCVGPGGVMYTAVLEDCAVGVVEALDALLDDVEVEVKVLSDEVPGSVLDEVPDETKVEVEDIPLPVVDDDEEPVSPPVILGRMYAG